jgi:hypothetical protein
VLNNTVWIDFRLPTTVVSSGGERVTLRYPLHRLRCANAPRLAKTHLIIETSTPGVNAVALVLLTFVVPLLVAAQAHSPSDDCARSGPRADEAAWLANVLSSQPRAYFLKSRLEDGDCPADVDKCRRNSYIVAGDVVLAWSRWGDTLCVMYTSAKGKTTVGRLWASAMDFHGGGRTLTVDDWVGAWDNEGSDASLTIRRLDAMRVEVSGSATWGGNDPERVANGGVHVGEIGPVRLRLTGHALHFVGSTTDGLGNSPPAVPGEYDCVVDMKWNEGSLTVNDNLQCGGMNVTFSGTYHRTRP